MANLTVSTAVDDLLATASNAGFRTQLGATTTGDALFVAAAASDARTTLGFSVTGGVLPISLGGTGATTASLARTALGSQATGDALFTAASASAARTTLGATTVGESLFTAASVAAAYTALNVAETAGVGPVTASTINTDSNVGSSISVVAGTYLIEINATFSNASTSTAEFRLGFGSNPFTANPQRFGAATTNDSSGTALYGNSSTGVGFVGASTAATTKCSVWASGILTFSGSNSIQLRVRNTAATGTVTCDAYRMTVKKIA